MMPCLDEHMYHGTHDGHGCTMCIPGSHRRGHWIRYNRLLIVMNHCVGAGNHTESSPRAESILKHCVFSSNLYTTAYEKANKSFLPLNYSGQLKIQLNYSSQLYIASMLLASCMT